MLAPALSVRLYISNCVQNPRNTFELYPRVLFYVESPNWYSRYMLNVSPLPSLVIRVSSSFQCHSVTSTFHRARTPGPVEHRNKIKKRINIRVTFFLMWHVKFVHASRSLFVYFGQRVVCALLRMALFGHDNEMEDN